MHTMAALVFMAGVIVAAMISVVDAEGGWRAGRATRYGGLEDPWSIHDGFCYHSYLGWDVKTGWDVAAMADAHPDARSGMPCGKCYEMRCRNADFTDGYGQKLSRSSVCHDEWASVVIQITDSCPCHYAANSYSNKRWCCGDLDHFDVSVWAFEKMASNKWGVIGIWYREVPCGYVPSKPAKLPSGQSMSPGYAPPSGWNSARDDPRPWPSSYHSSSSRSN